VLGAWELVNEASKKLWGITILDELSVDYEKETEWIGKLTNSNLVNPNTRSALNDLHALRGRLIQVLISNPGAIIDPIQFTRDLLFLIRPIPIAASRSGQLGSPPEGWARVISFKDRGYQGPEGEWWWAAGPEEWSVDAEDIALNDRDIWLNIVSDWAPIAKLMLNGRAHRTMLGPELLTAQMLLQDEGLEIVFDPMFRFPAETNEIKSFFELNGKSEVACDFCRAPVKKQKVTWCRRGCFATSKKTPIYALKGLVAANLANSNT